MRSAEVARSVWLLALCGVALVGCASAPAEPTPASSPAVAARAAVSTSAPAASAVAAKPVDPEVAVPPAAQRAFDDARRAMRAGRMDEAERGFKSVIQFHPELGGPHANLGVIYRQANKLPEAVAALEQAVKLSPRQPVYFNQLGITYRLQGQFAKARDAYERAIDLNPEYATATLNLGILSDLYLWDGKRALPSLYARYLVLTPAGDGAVTKWLAELKNRNKPAQAPAANRAQEEVNEPEAPACAVASAPLAAWAVMAHARFRRWPRTVPTSTARQIVGHRELPKVLVRSCRGRSRCPSELKGRPVSSVLDEALAPVDREVFQAATSHYDRADCVARDSGGADDLRPALTAPDNPK